LRKATYPSSNTRKKQKELPMPGIDNGKTTSYALTAEERAVMQGLASNAAQTKLQVYELNMQLEQAQRARDEASAALQGALILLANAHNLPGAALSQDFTTLTGVPKQ
jgi:hypothetical protein